MVQIPGEKGMGGCPAESSKSMQEEQKNTRKKKGRKVGFRHQDEAQDMSDDERRGSQSGLTCQINSINQGRKFAVQQRVLETNSSTGRVQMSFTSIQQPGELLNARIVCTPTAHVQPHIKRLVLSYAHGLPP